MPQMAWSWPTIIPTPSPLYHLVNLFFAESELITASAAAVVHPSSPSSSLVGAGTGLVHTDRLAQEFLPVKASNSRLSLRLR